MAADRTLIIGAGPAGLAAARALTEQGLPYDHVERHSDVGGLWDIDSPGTPMYESAHFISSRTMSGFPGYPMPENYPDYPNHRQILAYLRSFAADAALTDRITFHTEVVAIEREGDGTFAVTTRTADAAAEPTEKVTRYGQVIAASGVQWDPHLIEIPGYTGEIRHSVTYRDANEFVGRRVLIVGAGNSGCDIACDAARSADHAAISMRRGYWFIPKHIFGQPVDVFAESGPTMPMWLEQAVFGRLLRIINGDPTRLGLQKPDHKLFETHPLLNDQLMHHLQHGDITARPAIASADGTIITFTDGTSEDVDLVLLATGYKHTIPYAQDFYGDEQHPDMYLTAFARTPGLYGIGFVETNSGAYILMDMLSQMVAQHIADHTRRPDAWRAFERHVATDRPDLSGDIKFVDSPRHQGYVDAHAIQKYLRAVSRRMGWTLRA
ncbi:NAD(P)/FAD-dependent oxidoreductase [Demequina sp. NBRC 110051]|uniref:flavin-containing monooxygenase n=1 Tax=Demequina sp. NBRC 110051 TaxID=1570340 RepID=UPI00190EB910|nr:NAD(P)-binding domain-containing protein [Demequina sp. NBRC 110051]